MEAIKQSIRDCLDQLDSQVDLIEASVAEAKMARDELDESITVLEQSLDSKKSERALLANALEILERRPPGRPRGS